VLMRRYAHPDRPPPAREEVTRPVVQF
jgi:hypothetical protein